MTDALPSFAPGLLALAVHGLLLLIALRCRFPASPMAAHMACGLAGLASILAFAIFEGPGFWMWRSLALFGFGWSLLLFAYSAIYKSVSLRLLLAAADDRSPVGQAALADRILRRGFDERIELLMTRGLVERHADTYRITPAGRKMVASIERVREIFAARTSGMYGLGEPDRPRNP